MKLGIVGANGQVGTELSFLFDADDDIEVVPIVRNRLGTHFLRYHGLEPRVADVSDAENAREALSDLDAVVVAAFAWQYSHEGFQARGAREANEALVEHAVEYSPDDAAVVYFSSQAAFGDEIGAPQYNDWSLYTREKRNSEAILREACEGTDTDGYAFRLGFVHGRNQSRTDELRRKLADGPTVYVAVDPDKPSNVVHTVTLADAVRRCACGDADPGTYSIVNEPQWTWREVCAYYGDGGTELVYTPPGETSTLKRLLGRAWGLIESRERTLRTGTLYVPDAINQFLFHQYLKQQRGGELGELRDRLTVERDAFEFAPVPGPYLDLPTTRNRLDGYGTISGIFDGPDQR